MWFPPANRQGYGDVQGEGGEHQGVEHLLAEDAVLHVGDIHYHEGQFGPAQPNRGVFIVTFDDWLLRALAQAQAGFALM